MKFGWKESLEGPKDTLQEILRIIAHPSLRTTTDVDIEVIHNDVSIRKRQRKRAVFHSHENPTSTTDDVTKEESSLLFSSWVASKATISLRRYYKASSTPTIASLPGATSPLR